MEILGLAGAPLGAGAMGGKKGLPAVANHLHEISQNINLVVNVFLLFLLVIVFIICFIGIKRFFSYLCKKEIDKIKILLLKLQTDLITFKNIENFDSQQRLLVSQMIQEAVGFLKKRFEKNLFHRKLGKNFSNDITRNLDSIANNKINIQDQILLVDCWLKFFSTF